MMSDYRASLNAAVAATPAGYGRNKRLAFRLGWKAADEGASVNAAPDGAEWRQQVWLEGHAAHYAWLQQHRVRACDRVEVARG